MQCVHVHDLYLHLAHLFKYPVLFSEVNKSKHVVMNVFYKPALLTIPRRELNCILRIFPCPCHVCFPMIIFISDFYLYQ